MQQTLSLPFFAYYYFGPLNHQMLMLTHHQIHDDLYDLSSFAAHHPGGQSWIDMTKGQARKYFWKNSKGFKIISRISQRPLRQCTGKVPFIFFSIYKSALLALKQINVKIFQGLHVASISCFLCGQVFQSPYWQNIEWRLLRVQGQNLIIVDSLI